MKLVLINCYFGVMPNYFELWLQSCEANPQVDFILITDAKISTYIPKNIKIIHTTFDKLVRKIDTKFRFKISITSPYKLTDFKPAYGYIFYDLIAPYDYWGYCDLDLIFGNIMKFIEKPMQQGFDKIYRLGHLTIYKNTEKMRKLFSQKGGMFSYREVFSNPEFYSFDEHAGQMLIAKKQKVNEYYQEDMADISCRLNRLTASRHKNYPLQVFYYEEGAVYRAYLSDGNIKTDEYVYIHIQKRKYNYSFKYKSFIIMSDKIMPLNDQMVSLSMIKKYSEYVSDEVDREQVQKHHLKKISEFLKCSIREKRIWLRIKGAEICYSKMK